MHLKERESKVIQACLLLERIKKIVCTRFLDGDLITSITMKSPAHHL